MQMVQIRGGDKDSSRSLKMKQRVKPGYLIYLVRQSPARSGLPDSFRAEAGGWASHFWKPG